MPLSRRNRRLIVVSALLAVLAFARVPNRPSVNSDKFYAFLSQHPWLAQVVRVGFVLAGKQNEFDVQITIASLPLITIDLYDFIGSDELGILRPDELPSESPPPPPEAEPLL